MSLDITVYTKGLSDDLIPKILKRLNEFDMEVEIHPEFTFSDHKGFLPFKFRLKKPHLLVLEHKHLISGFELYIDDFDLKLAKENLKPKLSFMQKLLRKKQNEVNFSSLENEARLKDCNKAIRFVWSSGDSFELRFASLTSAIITEITNGVCTYPADDIWYENNDIVNEAFEEIKEYESTVEENDIKFRQFEQW